MMPIINYSFSKEEIGRINNLLEQINFKLLDLAFDYDNSDQVLKHGKEISSLFTNLKSELCETEGRKKQ